MSFTSRRILHPPPQVHCTDTHSCVCDTEVYVAFCTLHVPSHGCRLATLLKLKLLTLSGVVCVSSGGQCSSWCSWSTWHKSNCSTLYQMAPYSPQLLHIIPDGFLLSPIAPHTRCLPTLPNCSTLYQMAPISPQLLHIILDVSILSPIAPHYTRWLPTLPNCSTY